MSVIGSDLKPWSRGKWMFTILIATGIQFGLLFTLSNKSPIQPRVPKISPRITLLRDLSPELQALTDPTLLALGSPHGFASLWMESPVPAPLSDTWSEEPQWLQADPSRFGTAFRAFARLHLTSLHGLALKPPPQPRSDEPHAVFHPLRQTSTVRLSPELRNWRLDPRPDLPSIPAADVLKPSDVQVMLDSGGNVLTATLLESSGSRDADQIAVQKALNSRFAPVEPRSRHDELTLGRMVFNWDTVAPDQTNAPATSPSPIQ